MNNSNGVKIDSNTQDSTNIESSQNVAKTPVANQTEKNPESKITCHVEQSETSHRESKQGLDSKINLNKDISYTTKHDKKQETIEHHIKKSEMPKVLNNHTSNTDSKYFVNASFTTRESIRHDSINTKSKTQSIQENTKDSINSNNAQKDIQDTTTIPTHITIQVESRKFCLSLEKLDSICRQKIVSIFAQKQYTLEELLTLFVITLRDQSAAEQELIHIVHVLES